jgi:hypothetical protein
MLRAHGCAGAAPRYRRGRDAVAKLSEQPLRLTRRGPELGLELRINASSAGC